MIDIYNVCGMNSFLLLFYTLLKVQYNTVMSPINVFLDKTKKTSTFVIKKTNIYTCNFKIEQHTCIRELKMAVLKKVLTATNFEE